MRQHGCRLSALGPRFLTGHVGQGVPFPLPTGGERRATPLARDASRQVQSQEPGGERRIVTSGLALVVACAALLFAAPTTSAQVPDRERANPVARRVGDRIRELQAEAGRLAGEARSLVGDLRKAEIERDLQVEQVARADAAVAEAEVELQRITSSLASLEARRIAQLPDLKAQFVDMYKRGRSGYLRLLLTTSGVRDLSRTARAVAALVTINERRVNEHRQTLDTLTRERQAWEQKSAELRSRAAEAVRVRAAAERAVAARTALIARIDASRDLNAQLAGELQVAYEGLQRQFAASSSLDSVSVPLTPFRGALDWPASGPVTGRFAQPLNRPGGAAVRNGIEIAAPERSPVTAVHGGVVSYAEPFTGFGNLVILDHGSNNFSLYGYLGSMSVDRGQSVQAGAEIGRVGLAPAGPPLLYFEMRIDGRSVNPVQWLRPR